MIEGSSLRNLTSQERQEMIKIYQRTQKIRQFMKQAQKSMHHEFDQMLQSATYKCKYCSYEGQVKQIGAHYRNNKKCKYMKDRPFLKQLPPNWKTDLQQFQKQLQQEKRYQISK